MKINRFVGDSDSVVISTYGLYKIEFIFNSIITIKKFIRQ